MFRKFLVCLPPVLVVAALVAMPALSQAAPQWWMNGTKIGTKHVAAISFGKIKLTNGALGPLECETFLSEQLWNEVREGTERGFEETVGYGTWECHSETRCRVFNERGIAQEGIFVTAEGPPELKTEKGHRTGNTSLPWTGELTEKEPSAGVHEKYLLTHHVKVWVVVPRERGGKDIEPCPEEAMEIPFEDREGASEKERGAELGPHCLNGAKSGMTPSHLTLEGEKTEKSGARETGELEGELGVGFLAGSLLTTGANFELIQCR